MTDAPSTLKPMSLRFAGTCCVCARSLDAGTWAAYDRATRTVMCIGCMPADPADAPLDSGTAGASAQREFDRRAAKRETRIRTNHPIIGGALLALSEPPQSTRAWQVGARGETILGKRLDALVPTVQVLHDRRIPGTKANIDHIVVAPRGVFVIDAKRYTGAPSLRVEGWIARTEKLMVGSRDCTKLVAGMHHQTDVVTTALEVGGFNDLPVRGMLCFVEADWPLLGGDFTIDGVEVLWPKEVARRVVKAGELGGGQMDSVARLLARSFPTA